MTVPEFFDQAVKILNSLSELLSAGEKRRREVFQKHIVPAHGEMNKIREDYLNMFYRLQEDLKKAENNKEITKALKVFPARREPIVLARAKVRAMFSEEIVENWEYSIEQSYWVGQGDDSIELKLEQLAHYTRAFFLGLYLPRRQVSMATDVIQMTETEIFLEGAKTQEISTENRDALNNIIDESIIFMHKTWEEADRSYRTIEMRYG